VSVLIIAATPMEAALLRGAAAPLVVTGLGAVNTAHALTRALVTSSKPSLVIQTGIAGAYVPAGVAVGSLVLASEEVYGDVGAMTPDGWISSEAIGIPLVAAMGAQPARFNHFPLDASLVARAGGLCEAPPSCIGRFLTLSQVTGVRALGDELFARFGALCESMEGAAAAHVCALNGVPFLEVRAISNLVEDRDRASWRIDEAAATAQRAVLRLLPHVDDLVGAPGSVA
jgi:futalosine hydrolase